MIIIFEQVNPQNLVFIAFDGVAPRSKINQSRDRRFRAILDL
jgi:5'-3' exonuclease